MTRIEWTDETWNPITGCTRVSEGCRNCYAERMAARLATNPAPGMVERYGGDAPLATFTEGGPRWSGAVRFDEGMLVRPLRWQRRRRVFVCSMSDLFHEQVPDEWILRVFDVMRACAVRNYLERDHVFQVLTKRPERMADFCRRLRFDGRGEGRVWLDEPGQVTGYCLMGGNGCRALHNVWLGVSVEDQETANARIPHLVGTEAEVRFVSYEPALGPVSFRWAMWEGVRGHNHLDGLRRLNWVIAGGESGPGWRPADPQWFRDVRDQCDEAGVAFFMKQMAGREPIPDDLLVRQWPRGG